MFCGRQTKFEFEVRFRGEFHLSASNEIEYRGCEQHSFVDVDPHVVYMVVVKQMLGEDIDKVVGLKVSERWC